MRTTGFSATGGPIRIRYMLSLLVVDSWPSVSSSGGPLLDDGPDVRQVVDQSRQRRPVGQGADADRSTGDSRRAEEHRHREAVDAGLVFLIVGAEPAPPDEVEGGAELRGR